MPTGSKRVFLPDVAIILLMAIFKGSNKKISGTLTFLALTILLGVAAFLLVTRYTRAQLLDSFGERSFALTSFTMSEIDRSVGLQVGAIEHLATKISSSDILIDSNEDLSKLDNPQELIDERDEEWIATPDDETSELMEQLINNELSDFLREENPEILIDSEGNKYASFAEIIVTNKFGANVAQTSRTSDYYQADEEWWQQATKNGSFIESVELDESSDTYSIPISVTILDENGEVAGAIKAVWNIEEVIQLVSNLEIERQERNIFGATTNFTLLNGKDQVMFSSRDDLDFLEDIEADRIDNALAALNEEELYTITSATADQGDEVTVFVTSAESTGFGQYKGIGWNLVLEQSTDEILSPIRTAEAVIGLIILGFILTIGILIYRYTKRIREIQQLKEQFVSMAAHQLKTPIASMKWSLSALEDYREEISGEAQSLLSSVYDSSRQMAQLVNDLLNLSRLESGRLKINPEPIDISDKIAEIIETTRKSNKDKKLTISFDAPSEESTVPLDKSIFELIVSNVLSNAVKYGGDPCEVKVSLSLEKDLWKISITDNGMGIPKDKQDKIFQKFYRADNAVKSEKSGTGLGLYVVHNIAKGLGGDLWFESSENNGSTFYITLPKSGMKSGNVTTKLS